MAAMQVHGATSRAGAVVVGMIAWLAASACDTSHPHRDRFASGNPLDRARATVEVSRARDLQAVHKLVELLDDPEPAVRMYAILSLRQLCGEDFGYRYYERAAMRGAAIERWRAALREGRVGFGPAARRQDADAPDPGSPALESDNPRDGTVPEAEHEEPA